MPVLNINSWKCPKCAKLNLDNPLDICECGYINEDIIKERFRRQRILDIIRERRGKRQKNIVILVLFLLLLSLIIFSSEIQHIINITKITSPTLILLASLFLSWSLIITGISFYYSNKLFPLKNTYFVFVLLSIMLCSITLFTLIFNRQSIFENYFKLIQSAISIDSVEPIFKFFEAKESELKKGAVTRSDRKAYGWFYLFSTIIGLIIVLVFLALPYIVILISMIVIFIICGYIIYISTSVINLKSWRLGNYLPKEFLFRVGMLWSISAMTLFSVLYFVYSQTVLYSVAPGIINFLKHRKHRVKS
jgi:hypothetical protein